MSNDDTPFSLTHSRHHSFPLKCTMGASTRYVGVSIEHRYRHILITCYSRIRRIYATADAVSAWANMYLPSAYEHSDRKCLSPNTSTEHLCQNGVPLKFWIIGKVSSHGTWLAERGKHRPEHVSLFISPIRTGDTGHRGE